MVTTSGLPWRQVRRRCCFSAPDGQPTIAAGCCTRTRAAWPVGAGDVRPCDQDDAGAWASSLRDVEARIRIVQRGIEPAFVVAGG